MNARRPWPLLAFAAVAAFGLWLRDPQPSSAVAGERSDAAAMRDIAYGTHANQRYDLYAPTKTAGAPTIFFVHGGGWRRGDKAMAGMIDAKQRRWTAAGAFVVSANYRMVPDADPLGQARDVARAIASAQQRVATLGGDPNAFVLMGHSAGAHLVGLVATMPEISRDAGVVPWRGNVLLDSGAIDTVKTMEARWRPQLFADAFGDDPAYWRSASPMHRLSGKLAPTLVVCASERADSCPNNAAFLRKAREYGTRTQLLAKPMSHGDINRDLGEDNDYTREVEAFMRDIGVRLGE
ncbi:MAG: alpha/beta hydrolase [Xanthomonadaceae bacterium]|nr:alpha/beta hydrolase [Xanthomonadaceae bacterium]